MSELSIELGEELSTIGCDECGGDHKSAYGFICKNEDAYGVYFASLFVGAYKAPRWPDSEPGQVVGR